MIQGMRVTLPRTGCTPARISQSMVPLFFVIAKTNVTPARITNRSPGKPPAIAVKTRLLGGIARNAGW